MELLRWKIRISMLWMIMVVNYLLLGIFRILSLKASGGTGGEETITFIHVLFAFIPFIMAWLSLTLKDWANRWINLILGILFAVMFIVAVITGLADANATADTATMIPIELAMFLLSLVASLLIIWYAWKWPKQ